MFAVSDLSALPKAELYRELIAQISALIEGETDPVANMANCAALIFNSVPRPHCLRHGIEIGNRRAADKQ